MKLVDKIIQLAKSYLPLASKESEAAALLLAIILKRSGVIII